MITIEKVKQYIDYLLNKNVKSYDIALRRGRYSTISYSMVDMIKKILEYLLSLTPEEIQKVRNDKVLDKYEGSFMELYNKKKAKEVTQNISRGDDFYSVLIQTIKDKAEDFISTNEKNIKDKMERDWKRIHDEYDKLHDRTITSPFYKKYGSRRLRNDGSEYYSMYEFDKSYMGQLLRIRNSDLPNMIKLKQEQYRKSEYNKVDRLVYRLKEKYPDITNYEIKKFSSGASGIEFYITAEQNGEPVQIHTHTIYAGGYNIQRLHLRWLMSVTDSKGKTVKIKS